MTVTLLSGPETTIQNTDNNIRGMDANVYELEPSAAPLCALMDMMGSVSTGNPKVEWLMDQSMPRITTITATATSAATSFTVAADYFRVGDVVRFSSLGFGLLITSTAANTIAGTVLGTGVSAATGSEVYLVGNANAEGATLRELKFPQLTTDFNYCEIFRTPFGVTTTELGTAHYGGNERNRLRKKFGIEHARSIEDTHFFGLRSINSTTRTAGGLLSYISTNVTADTGGLTRADWETFLKQAFRYGSERKVAFCSPTAMAALEAFPRSNQRVVNDLANKFGINMSQYISGQGTVDLVMHRNWNDSTVWGGYIFLVDMEAVRERPLQNVGSTRLLPDRQAPDYDGVKDEYRSELCLQVIQEARHALLTGVSVSSSP